MTLRIIFLVILAVSLVNIKAEENDSIVIDFHLIKKLNDGQYNFYTPKSCSGKIRKNDSENIFLRAFVRLQDTVFVTDSIKYEIMLSAGGFMRWMNNDTYNYNYNNLDSLLSVIPKCSSLNFYIKNVVHNGVFYSPENVRYKFYSIGCKGYVYLCNGPNEIDIKRNKFIKDGCLDEEIFIEGPFLPYDLECNDD